jgi:hypothetical protein
MSEIYPDIGVYPDDEACFDIGVYPDIGIHPDIEEFNRYRAH